MLILGPILESAWTAPVVAFIAVLILYDIMCRRARRRAQWEVRRHDLAVRAKARRDRVMRRRREREISL